MSLLGPVQIRRLAEQIGLKPSKRFGQNFVHDGATVRKIVRLAEVGGAHVLEIGPGLGSLTLVSLVTIANKTQLSVTHLRDG